MSEQPPYDRNPDSENSFIDLTFFNCQYHKLTLQMLTKSYSEFIVGGSLGRDQLFLIASRDLLLVLVHGILVLLKTLDFILPLSKSNL